MIFKRYFYGLCFLASSLMYLLPLNSGLTAQILSFKPNNMDHTLVTNNLNRTYEHIGLNGNEFNPTSIDMGEGNILVKHETVNRISDGYPNIRLYTDFELLTVGTDDMKKYIKRQLIPSIIDYFESCIKIKYPINNPIKTNLSKLCGFMTPISLINGVDADVVFFFNSVDLPKSSWIAAATHCMLANPIKKPMIVNIGINTALLRISDVNVNPITHDQNINILAHEFIHGLGMDGIFFNYYLDLNGNILRNHIKKIELGNVTRTVLDLPPLTDRLKKFYNCDQIEGLFLENGGAHFARRFFQWDIMSTAVTIGSKISEITLGFLEGTGWYIPNYDFADPYYFGKNRGCDFYADTTNMTNYGFSEYCVGNGIGCTAVGNSGGYCIRDSLIGVAGVIVSQYAFNCENPNGTYYVPYASKQVFGRGLNSKCFTGNLSNNDGASQSSYCLTYNCMSKSKLKVLHVMWGTNIIKCEKKGEIRVSGYKGYLNCPDPLIFCSTIGVVSCQRNCMGRGVCKNGFCQCNEGFTGIDCGFVI